MIQLGNMTLERPLTFRLNEKPNRPLLRKDEKTLGAISYSLSRNTLRVRRTVYGIFDLMGDVGGVSTSIMTSLMAFVYVIGFNRDKLEFALDLYSKKELVENCSGVNE